MGDDVRDLEVLRAELAQDNMTVDRLDALEASIDAGDVLTTRDARALIAMARRFKWFERQPSFGKLASAMAGTFAFPKKRERDVR